MKARHVLLRIAVALAALALVATLGGCAHNEAQTAAQAPAQAPLQPVMVASNAPMAPAAATSGSADPNNLLEAELAQSDQTPQVTINDPIEPWNRFWFSFNHAFFHDIMKPVIDGYNWAIPTDYRISFKNFFRNLFMPGRLLGAFMAGDVKQAGIVLTRFAINTTAGVLGFGDPAEEVFGLKKQHAGPGIAMGKWGVGHGFYIVWPLLGPSSLRDTTGIVTDIYLTPIFWVDSWEAAVAIAAFGYTNQLSFSLDDYFSFTNASFDPYVAVRNAYAQYRQQLVEGKPEGTGKPRQLYQR